MADIFRARLVWSGAAHGATTDPRTFSRDLEVTVGSATLPMSAAPKFRGDASRLNPEELFVAALSSCQALSYLYLAAKHGVAVAGYEDEAEGQLGLVDGRMRVSRVVLHPRITLADANSESTARELVERAHAECFIANSTTSTVTIEPVFDVVPEG
jgi:organic hydroperoxide reductase OsmC/OhrA